MIHQKPPWLLSAWFWFYVCCAPGACRMLETENREGHGPVAGFRDKAEWLHFQVLLGAACFVHVTQSCYLLLLWAEVVCDTVPAHEVWAVCWRFVEKVFFFLTTSTMMPVDVNVSSLIFTPWTQNGPWISTGNLVHERNSRRKRNNGTAKGLTLVLLGLWLEAATTSFENILFCQNKKLGFLL